jgi:(+)-trans-carveol dehydrogenase
VRFEGKTALITGAARGQGRSHAVALAREGADVAVCDICAQIDSVAYPLAGDGDLDETVRLVEAEGRRAVRGVVDVRSSADLKGFADTAIETFGKIDVLIANAGIGPKAALLHEQEEQMFDDVIAVNLKGVWLTIKAVVPHMIDRHYGRIVITGSSAGLIGAPTVGPYCASKAALGGIVKTLALEQAANGITANMVAPTVVATPMMLNEVGYTVFSPERPTKEAVAELLAGMHPTQRPWIEPEEVTRLVLFLASDDARSVTGCTYPIEMGWLAR